MSIKIGGHVFDGPFTTTKDLMNDPGVFAVIVAKDDRGTLIDVGESNNVGECIETHKSRTKWSEFASTGKLCFAVLYTPSFDEAERSSIEQEIRSHFEQDTQRKNTAGTRKGDSR
jgi:hypothetical protein